MGLCGNRIGQAFHGKKETDKINTDASLTLILIRCDLSGQLEKFYFGAQKAKTPRSHPHRRLRY